MITLIHFSVSVLHVGIAFKYLSTPQDPKALVTLQFIDVKIPP